MRISAAILLMLLTFSVHAQESWTVQNSGVTVNLHDILFISDYVGWASGDSGTIIHTNDGGITWMKQETGVTEGVTNLAFADESNGYALTNSSILSTKNEGTNWISATPDTSYRFIDMCIANSETVWVIVQNQYSWWNNLLILTLDGGKNWENVLEYEAMGSSYLQLEDILYTSENTLWLVESMQDETDNLLIKVSEDNGQNWSVLPTTGYVRWGEIGIVKTELVNPDMLWILADLHLYVLPGTGSSYQDVQLFDSELHVNEQLYVFQIWPHSSTELLFSGTPPQQFTSKLYYGDILSGSSRKIYNERINDAFIYGKNIWVVADSGKIIHNNTIITSVEPVQQVPQKPLLIGNYPNPFNPTTTIEFYLDRVDDITLTIYNIQGREVKTLSNGRTAPGLHSVTWDGTNSTDQSVAGGVYIYRLVYGKTVRSGKMLLIK